MPYILGTNFNSGRFTIPAPKPSNARLNSPLTPQIPDEEDALGRKSYIDYVYGGLVSDRPEVPISMTTIRSVC